MSRLIHSIQHPPEVEAAIQAMDKPCSCMTDQGAAKCLKPMGECPECGHPCRAGDETHYPECKFYGGQ